MTFSIAAIEPESNKTGVAIATVFPAVGAICPFVNEKVAVSTQSWDSGRSYGEDAVEMVNRDLTLPTACEALLEDHEGASYTQLHGIESGGRKFSYTGDHAVSWAGHDDGENHTVAGNMLAGEETIQATSEAFEESEGSFEERLLTALEAGEEAGGDKRGDNISAALLIHAPEPKLYHNLRVDKPGSPIADLREAYDVAKETEEDLPNDVRDDVGEDYPESLIQFDIKY